MPQDNVDPFPQRGLYIPCTYTFYRHIPQGYDGGDCCACTCVDGTDYSCGDSGYDCQDPTAGCTLNANYYYYVYSYYVYSYYVCSYYVYYTYYSDDGVYYYYGDDDEDDFGFDDDDNFMTTDDDDDDDDGDDGDGEND